MRKAAIIVTLLLAGVRIYELGEHNATQTQLTTPAAITEQNQASPATVPATTTDPATDPATPEQPSDPTPLSNNDHYTNSDGQTVHSPAYSPDGVPAGATAQCRDGSYSFSQHRRGTCSYHGGVDHWLY